MREEASKKVELLAPAGTYECFEAAITAGADAVYMALNKFGARAFAGNFSEEEILKALDIANLLGKKIYLTVNILLKDSEFEQLYNMLLLPYKHGLHGVIVQDLGVVSFLREKFPGLSVHSSTQMTLTDSEGVELAKSLGIERVVLSRELSLEEIARIYKETGVEIEAFVHGALCYSYSGKCLMSSMIGGRSGNRGRCAQPCRLTYNGEYLLSMKDLCSIENIPQMIKAGIASFKIEGRMKSPDYVYGVTSIYRKYIDLYYSGNNYKVSPNDKDLLLSVYTRGGNCDGYAYKSNGREMITISSPSYSSASGTSLSSEKTDYSIKQKLEIDIICNIYKEQKVSMSVIVYNDESPAQFDFDFDIVAQKAKNAPVTSELVAKQLCKTGETIFRVRECFVNMDDDIFIANGQLNYMRREALEEVYQNLLSKYMRDCAIDSYVDEVYENVSDNVPEIRHKERSVNVSVSTTKQFEIVAANRDISAIIIPTYILAELIENESIYSKSFELINKNDVGIYISYPYICRKDGVHCSIESADKLRKSFEQFIAEKYKIEVKGYYISNYEELYYLNNEMKTDNTVKSITGDIHMYAYNRRSANCLHANGVSKLTVPIELNLRELKQRRIFGEELIIYGKYPVMISAQCVKKTNNICRRGNGVGFSVITDRKGNDISCASICNECTSVIYNSVPLLLKDDGLYNEIKPMSYRIHFTDESKSDIENILGRIDEFFGKSEKYNGDKTASVALVSVFTRGHIRRGVD